MSDDKSAASVNRHDQRVLTRHQMKQRVHVWGVESMRRLNYDLKKIRSKFKFFQSLIQNITFSLFILKIEEDK